MAYEEQLAPLSRAKRFFESRSLAICSGVYPSTVCALGLAPYLSSRTRKSKEARSKVEMLVRRQGLWI